MLRSVKDIRGYLLKAQDGEIGKCSDFLIDDKQWVVRYIVVDTMKWLPGRKVLISPISIGDAEALNRRLDVALTKDQIKEAPPLDADAPISRQYELDYNRYHDLANCWVGTPVWEPHVHPFLLHRSKADSYVSKMEAGDPHLRSAKEVMGYNIQATDAPIGHIADFIVDQDTWIVPYLVIDTINWRPTSKKVLIKPDWVEKVGWRRKKLLLDLTSDQIKNSPTYDPSMPVNQECEVRLYDYYGRPYDRKKEGVQ
ncbi:hypothetical protein DSCA_00420 [Desulfosarcina alkanivorans]|uniref:PRC-barrel domain-containing protein n=1 Tax=Desulfosarcina alkanivorans TaxID=571177 RepID=A0A5K7Y9R4_9BACT|nr:PRC-barrel domain-containing protein [Desulfosarcina alkanivorans]BBO66112.1 hypothetical protein DSCA_00420 [Desulfosarcina alkanivorans]